MNRIIFGGGFDPVHLGHINMALIAKKSLNAEVIFVPAKIAIWKNDSIEAKHNMIKKWALCLNCYNTFEKAIVKRLKNE